MERRHTVFFPGSTKQRRKQRQWHTTIFWVLSSPPGSPSWYILSLPSNSRFRLACPCGVCLQGKGLASALHSRLPARLLHLPRSWGALLLPPGTTARPSLSSLRKLGSVRSMGDLKRELAAAATAAAAARTAATKQPAREECDKVAAGTGTGTGGLTLKKTGGGKQELAVGEAAQDIAVPAVAVAAASGDRAGAETAVGAAPAEGKAPVVAKASMGSTDHGDSPEAGRPADPAAAAAVADASGDPSSASGGKLAAGEGTAADAGIDAASPTSKASGRGQRGSSPSRKRRSAGSRSGDAGELPPSGNSTSGSRTSSAPMGVVSAVLSTGGLEANAGASSTAVTNVRRHKNLRWHTLR